MVVLRSAETWGGGTLGKLQDDCFLLPTYWPEVPRVSLSLCVENLQLAGSKENRACLPSLAVTSPSARTDLLKSGLPQIANVSIGGLETFSHWAKKMHGDWWL